MLLRLLKSRAINYLPKICANHSCLWNAEKGCGYVSSAPEMLAMWAWCDELCLAQVCVYSLLTGDADTSGLKTTFWVLLVKIILGPQ